jgi:hypothetical protein
MDARLVPERVGGDEGEDDEEGDGAAGDRRVAADHAAEHGCALQPETADAAAPVRSRPGFCRPFLPLGDFRLLAAIEKPLFEDAGHGRRRPQSRRKLDRIVIAGAGLPERPSHPLRSKW